MVEMIFVENVCFSGRTFCNATGSLGCFCFSWNLGYDTLEVKYTLHALIGSSMLHDRIKKKQEQHCIVADRAWTSYLCLFCVLREKVRARSSENWWIFDLRVFASCVHRHRRGGSDPRKGTACASDAASGCKPEFSHGSGSGASAHA